MSLPATVVALLVGLALLEVGAERLTAAIGGLSRRWRAPESVVGLLTAGGEWEELAVVGIALASGHPGLAVGNIIGACLANLLGSLPLGMLGPRPLRPDRAARVYGIALLAVTTLAAALLARGRVTATAGSVLVAIFAGYALAVVLTIRNGWLRPLTDDDDDDEFKTGTTPWLLAQFAAGLAVVTFGAELVVQGASALAARAGLSDFVIGATVVAIGTTLPDKMISLVGGLRGQSGVVFANASGSNIFVLTLVLGLAGLGTPGGVAVAPGVARVDVPLLLAATTLVAFLFWRPALHRGTGVVLLGLYVAYLAYSFSTGG